MEARVERQINIKGIREGLLVTIGGITSADVGAFNDMITQLRTELAEKQEFLQGRKMVLQIGNWSLRRQQLAEIKQCFDDQGLTLWTVLTDETSTRAAARELGLATRLPGSQTDLEGNALPAKEGKLPSPAEGERRVPAEQDSGRLTDAMALVIKETLRSGRSVYHEGHVVIVGDVNPGAEVIAAGDVIVWGRLRGLVHAGALGDESAAICALELNPTQLRIANHIAVPPDDRDGKPVPEQALIRSGQIIAEPWQSKS